jgi:pimeloyl-ACP methyl ester carboxylesterase
VTDDPRARPLPYEAVGSGPTILLLHGYGMEPETYLDTARLLADRVCVVIPDLFALPERWTFDHTLDCLELTLDDLGVERVSLLGHSFGGGLELGLAARSPARVTECVFSDTLGMNREFSLAREAVHPIGILRMATPTAARSFVRSWLRHPVQLSAAALWAFRSNRETEIEAIAAARLPCHVMWAARDTILSRKDGKEFARRLHATFTVAEPPPGYGPIDHDWMFDDPELFVQHLDKLGLRALSG